LPGATEEKVITLAGLLPFQPSGIAVLARLGEVLACLLLELEPVRHRRPPVFVPRAGSQAAVS
jgi:hypothetical protein